MRYAMNISSFLGLIFCLCFYIVCEWISLTSRIYNIEAMDKKMNANETIFLFQAKNIRYHNDHNETIQIWGDLYSISVRSLSTWRTPSSNQIKSGYDS